MRTPKLFSSRVDQLLTRLRSVDVHKTERQRVRNLSDHYEIEKRSRLDSPFLRRQDVEHIVRASWATLKTRQPEQRSTSEVTPNPHALVAHGGCGGPRRGSGRSSVTGCGIQQSWSRGGGNHNHITPTASSNSIVVLTSNGARNPVLSACLLPPRVIAYCSSSTSR